MNFLYMDSLPKKSKKPAFFNEKAGFILLIKEEIKWCAP